MRAAYPIFLTCWLAAFSVEAGLIAYRASILRRMQEQLEMAAQDLDAYAKTARQAANESVAQAKQLEFLEGLVNLLPQEKGFIRTQKAIAAEVEVLRRKVGRRLGNQLHIVVDT